MILAHTALAVFIALTPPNDRLTPDSMMVELRKGGYTIIWRHAATDYSTRDVPGAPPTDRSQQRNLTPQGAMDAEIIGRMLKLRGVPIGEVLASPMFRTRETAERAFGRTEVTMLLRQLEATPEQRAMLMAAPAKGTNRVLVTHHFIIERNAQGIRPGDVAEGEAAVVRANGDVLETIAVFKMADWRRLAEATPGSGVTPNALATPIQLGPPAGAPPAGPPAPPPSPSTTPLVLPELLQTPRNAIIANYLQTFNAGDATRMQAFFEQFSVPNPARTMAQRLESYARLRGDLGNLTITSAEAAGENQVAVKVAGSTGRSGTYTFTLEPAAPGRIVSINVQYGP
jgi:phosphohistidine phosphatase SixA